MGKYLSIEGLTEEQVEAMKSSAERYRKENAPVPNTLEHCYEKVKPLHFIGGMNALLFNSEWVNDVKCYNQLPTENHCKQIQAIMKEMVVAAALNGDWVPDWDDDIQHKYSVYFNGDEVDTINTSCGTEGPTYFKSNEAALKAIEILGKETLKQARGIFA